MGCNISHLFHDIHPTKEREHKDNKRSNKVISIDKYYVEYKNDSFKGLNLLNIQLFQRLFRNINIIEIIVYHYGMDSNYSFDLLSFLKLIQDQKTNIKYHIQAVKIRYKDSWLCRCLTPFVTSSYKHKQWIIKYERTGDWSQHDNIFINFCV